MARHQREGVHIEAAVLLPPNEVRALSSKLCVNWGFCLPPDEIEQLLALPPIRVDEFTDGVFVAEGLDPATADRQLLNKVRVIVEKAFVDYMSLNPI